MKKLLGVIVIAFAVFFLLTQPQAAANAVRGAGTVVQDAFNAVITFVTALFR
jgi:predicted small secreted protein